MNDLNKVVKNVVFSTNQFSEITMQQRSPSWLLCDYINYVWTLKRHIKTDELSRYTIDWSPKRSLGINNRWDYWVERAKDQLYCRMETLFLDNIKTSTLAGYGRSLRKFYSFLCFERKCFSLQDVGKEDIDVYKKTLVKRDLSRATIEGYLLPILDLFKLGKELQETLTFNPFRGDELWSFARKNTSNKGGHTETLLPGEIFYLINEAIKLVKNADKTLDLLDKYVFIKANVLDGQSSASIFKKQYNYPVSKLIVDTRALYGAAITVILVLIAERKHELALRSSKDVLGILNSELDILYGLEKKTSGSESGKRTKVPVIKEVKDAFRVIMRLTSHKRLESNSQHVLLKLPLQHSTSGNTNKSYYLHTNSLYSVLEVFSQSVNFTRVTLRPHMFRRAFAMLWMWRYEIGGLEELSLLLKHNQSEFTRAYTDDEDVWQFMSDVEQKMTFSILNNAFLKKTTINGGASAALNRYGRLIQANSKLLDSTAIAEFIDDLIVSKNLKVIPHSDGYCFISNSTKKNSKCLDEEGELSEAKREEKRCVGCPNLCIDDKRKEHWEKRIQLHQNVVDSYASSEVHLASMF
ncbi:site-specific integrase [Shewanella sp. SG41-4]|uniref:site-specific integrase n=1 Tax=Shewanella sp. SG41-4 TaxID=2760976 RepID=UPI0016026110|nr:site-specific integrase [Shewanella sp. SG41-4]MBB1440874.1 site-specific integrase [Shewanella sp. SG41-4]